MILNFNCNSVTSFYKKLKTSTSIHVTSYYLQTSMYRFEASRFLFRFYYLLNTLTPILQQLNSDRDFDDEAQLLGSWWQNWDLKMLL